MPLLALCAPARGEPAPEGSDGAWLERGSVPASGEAATGLRVERFGRYSIRVESDTGVSVRVVDRMSGPGQRRGSPGGSDGRIDAFLDAGDYRVLTEGAGGAAGEARLRVLPFEELAPEPVRLVDLVLHSSRLGDLEARSWWIEVDRNRRLVVEAAGRHLSDLRLWRDGSWMLGAEPETSRIEPEVGRPLRLFRLSAALEPGLYRLTAYGGTALGWPNDDGNRPLYLRSGVAELPEASRRHHTLSPFGFDRFLVPGGADYLRLERRWEEASTPAGVTSLEVAPWSVELPFARGEQARITKETVGQAVELFPSLADHRRHLVTVRGRAGEEVVLQHFRRADDRRFRGSGRMWIDTVFSGHPADFLPSTALLVPDRRRDEPARVVQAASVPLEASTAWRRRFDARGSSTLFLEVKEGGAYAVRTEGEGRLDHMLEPFFVPGTEPRGADGRISRPDPKEDGGTWRLDPGHYRLTLEPRRPGVAELEIRGPAAPQPAGAPADSPPAEDGTPDTPPRAGGFGSTLRLGAVELRRGRYHTAYLGPLPGAYAGLVVRSLPLDLTDPLPLVLVPGERVVLPMRAGESGVLSARAETGEPLALSLDG